VVLSLLLFLHEHIKKSLEHSKMEAIFKPGMGLNRNAGTCSILVILDWRPPENWENKCLLHKATQSMVFCYGAELTDMDYIEALFVIGQN
jgi:hypothetical protein